MNGSVFGKHGAAKIDIGQQQVVTVQRRGSGHAFSPESLTRRQALLSHEHRVEALWGISKMFSYCA